MEYHQDVPASAVVLSLVLVSAVVLSLDFFLNSLFLSLSANPSRLDDRCFSWWW